MSPAQHFRRSRFAIMLLFIIMGTTSGSWAARAPDVKKAVGLDNDAWGIISTSTTAGSLIALGLVTAYIRRLGSRRLALAGATIVLLNAPFQASASSVYLLLAGLILAGFASSVLSPPMNAQAVEVERAYDRPILSGFHACFSIGLLAGGLLGTIAAALDVSPGEQLAFSSVVLGTLLFVMRRWLPRDEPSVQRSVKVGLRARFTPQLLLLALIAFLASIIQVAATQWSAIYTAQTLGAGTVVGAATYTSLAIAESVVRLGGDRVVGRLGRVRLLRFGALTAALGLLMALLIGTPAASIAGFAILGFGMGCALPTVFGFAGNQPGLTSGEGVSVAVLGQWPAYVVAPALIGTLSGATGLRVALGVLVFAALAVAVLVGGVRVSEGGTPQSVELCPNSSEEVPVGSLADV